VLLQTAHAGGATDGEATDGDQVQVTLHRTAHAGGAAGRWIADVAHGQKGGAALALLVRLSGCICIRSKIWCGFQCIEDPFPKKRLLSSSKKNHSKIQILSKE